MRQWVLIDHNRRVSDNEPVTVRSYPAGSLIAEHRANATDHEDQLLGWWQNLASRIASAEAALARDPRAEAELSVMKDQRAWIELFLHRPTHGNIVVNPTLPIADLFLDEQCPVIATAWGPAAPTCAALFLMNELPANSDELNAQLHHLKQFVTSGPPRCAGVALYSAVTKLGTARFDHPETFLVEDPAAVLRKALSVEHTTAARRYYAGRMALPAVLIAVGNGLLLPRTVKEQLGKREFARRPNASVEVREVVTAPLSHLGPDLWRRLHNFTALVERREVARVQELLDDYRSKQQFLRAANTAGTLGEFAARTRRELNFTIGWTPDDVNRLLTDGTNVITQHFDTWRRAAADTSIKKRDEGTQLVTKPRRRLGLPLSRRRSRPNRTDD